MFKKATIIGTGMIGGSLALALKKKGFAQRICAVDINPDTIIYALAYGIADEATQNLQEGVAGADLVVIATPVGTTISILRDIKPYLEPGTLVTDVGSTKLEIVTAAEELLLPDFTFIGGHPMAGSEVAGIEGSIENLLSGATYILTPTNTTPQDCLSLLHQVLKGLGAQVIEMDPETHDYLVSAVSHLPHILSVTLVNTVVTVQETYPHILELAAGGFRDTTRIAASSPDMWHDIIRSNRENILTLIDNFSTNLTLLRNLIAEEDSEGIRANLINAQSHRKDFGKK